jgi:hypothetical protein
MPELFDILVSYHIRDEEAVVYYALVKDCHYFRDAEYTIKESYPSAYNIKNCTIHSFIAKCKFPPEASGDYIGSGIPLDSD